MAVSIWPRVVATRSPVIRLSITMRPRLALSAPSSSSGRIATVNPPWACPVIIVSSAHAGATASIHSAIAIQLRRRHPAPAVRGRTRPASACQPQRSFGDGPIDIGWSLACCGVSIRPAMAPAPHGEEAGKKGRPWPRRSSGSSALGFGLVGFLVTLGLGGLELLTQLGLEPLGHLRVLLEVVAGVLLALADALAAVAVPGT